MANKKSSRRRKSGGATNILLVLCIAVAAAWLVANALGTHRATHSHRAHPILAEVTPAPAATAQPPGKAATEQPSPSPVPAASATGQAASGAQLAVIIDDCGQWLATERAMIALPVPITLSVLPDVRYTRLIAQEAAQAGKGVMLHLPMEPESEINPGPGKITTEMTDAQILAQVRSDVEQVPLARGVNNHEGSKATSDPRVMHDVISVLAKYGLFFVDSKTAPSSVGEQEAQRDGVPTASRNVFLDNRADVAYTENMLRDAATIAKRDGSAIAIGHPRPTTLEALQAVIPQLQAEGIHFTLVKNLVR